MTDHATSDPPARAVPRPDGRAPAPRPRTGTGRLRRLVGRVGTAVRGAHAASVPF